MKRINLHTYILYAQRTSTSILLQAKRLTGQRKRSTRHQYTHSTNPTNWQKSVCVCESAEHSDIKIFRESSASFHRYCSGRPRLIDVNTRRKHPLKHQARKSYQRAEHFLRIYFWISCLILWRIAKEEAVFGLRNVIVEREFDSTDNNIQPLTLADDNRGAPNAASAIHGRTNERMRTSWIRTGRSSAPFFESATRRGDKRKGLNGLSGVHGDALSEEEKKYSTSRQQRKNVQRIIWKYRLLFLTNSTVLPEPFTIVQSDAMDFF